MSTIKCKVVADKVWDSTSCRHLKVGDIVEFPAKVKDHKGEFVPFKVGDSFEVVKDEPKGKKAADDLV